MTTAIVIGTYKLPQFVELCIRRCVLLWPDAPILLSDDKSDQSGAIEALADHYKCSYVVSEERRSHFSGDMQSFLYAANWADHCQSDVVLKISQRFIPVLPAFRAAMEKTFLTNRAVQVILPGQPQARQIARPSAGFYSKFGILTDVLAMRRGAISAAELLQVYRDRVTHPKSKSDSFVETTWGWLLEHRFKESHMVLPDWTNHKPFKPKMYLRKSQSNEADYVKIATIEGVKGPWDLREWGLIEQQHYMARPAMV